MADIDHFKSVNDTFGHPAGDAALSEIAKRLSAVLRPSDSLGRYGGEELLAVLPNCGLEDAIAVAERMRRAVSDISVNMVGGGAKLTLSLGLTVGDERGFSADDLIKTADEALYRAKRRGRNRVEVSPHPEDIYRLDVNHWDFDRIL
jgi:two-component system, cell cycle response regulator